MGEQRLIYNGNYNYIYHLYINTLLGKLIKRGDKFKALKIYKNLRENIKLKTNKENEVFFIFLLSVLKSKPKVSFKEIRLGSQKKEMPMPVGEKKQVLICVESLLKFSKVGKKLELSRLVDCIASAYKFKGPMIRFKLFKYKKALDNRMLLNLMRPKNFHKKKKYNVSKKNNYKIYQNKTAL